MDPANERRGSYAVAYLSADGQAFRVLSVCLTRTHRLHVPHRDVWKSTHVSDVKEFRAVQDRQTFVTFSADWFHNLQHGAKGE